MPPTEYIKMLTALLVIVNPIGAMPVFVSLTSHQSESQRRRTALAAAVSVGVVLAAACLLGQGLLAFLGIRIGSFQVGGGILLLMIAVNMLHARQSASKHTPEEGREAQAREEIGVVPLALPLLSGPGSISTMIIYSHQAGAWYETVFLLFCSGVVGVAAWLALRSAIPLSRKLGQIGLNVVTRLMGLLLAAIAVEVIAKGLLELFPALAG